MCQMKTKIKDKLIKDNFNKNMSYDPLAFLFRNFFQLGEGDKGMFKFFKSRNFVRI